MRSSRRRSSETAADGERDGAGAAQVGAEAAAGARRIRARRSCRLHRGSRGCAARSRARSAITPSVRVSPALASGCRDGATRGRSRAGASCTGCCRRCPRFRPSSAPRRARRTSRARSFGDAGATRSCAKCWRCSTTRASPRCLRRVRAPRCRSSACCPTADASPGRRTASPSRRDEVLVADYKSNRAVPGRIDEIPAGLHRATCALSRRAAPPLSRSRRARRAGLDRRARPHGTCRTPRSTRMSSFPQRQTPRRDRALTLRMGVHSFPRSKGRAPPANPKNRGAPWASQRFPIRISTPRC